MRSGWSYFHGRELARSLVTGISDGGSGKARLHPSCKFAAELALVVWSCVISDIFQEIRKRTKYVSEVQSHIHAVLAAFQQDARSQGRRIKFAASPPDTATGGTVELTELPDQAGNSSSVILEINCTGDVLIWRNNTVDHRSEPDEVERRPLNLSQPAVSTAVDVLLIMADDHRGYVGTSLEHFLNASALNQALEHTPPHVPPTL